MALLRAELKGAASLTNFRREDGSVGSKAVGLYDGVIEREADLSLPRLGDFAPGSLLFCLENGNLYIKSGGDEWEAVAE